MIIAPRIEADPEVCAGKPCIEGTRLAVGIILEWLEAGKAFEDILEAYPFLKREDIVAAIRYARQTIEGEEIVAFEMAT